VRALRAINYPGRIMVFSSELSPAVAEDYRRNRVDRILYKPVYPSMMREVIEQLFAPAATTSPSPVSLPPA
jgi:two-component system chemotaxis response regulator CheY